MEAETWGADQHSSSVRACRRMNLGWRFANGLIISGVLLLVGAAVYGTHALLSAWLVDQDRYLLNPDVAPLSIHDGDMPPGNSTAGPSAISLSQPSTDVSAAPPSSPIQIRIPALGVRRSIIELPLTRNPRTRAWRRDLDVLLRAGQLDLVGHWGGSACPGQAGNTILVGHNYGYGYQGVFVRLGRLKAGQEIELINEEGESFAYEVKTVDRIKWRRKDLEEMLQHSGFLAQGGPERLTLVTCAGASLEPFPERIYVVAEPVH